MAHGLNLYRIPALWTLMLIGALTQGARAVGGEPTSAPLTIQLQDNRPIPKHLVPALVNAHGTGGLGGTILPSTSGKDPEQWLGLLKPMKPVSAGIFVTTAPVDRGELWLLIDHPGYLRGYRTKIPELADPRTTVVLHLPQRGQLITPLNLTRLRSEAGTAERWNEALKTYCVSADVRAREPFYYDISYRHPLDGWQFKIDDLAPADYSLTGSARWCDAHSGPAGYVVQLEFTVKPGFTTRFKTTMVPRSQWDKPAPPPDLAFQPVTDGAENAKK